MLRPTRPPPKNLGGNACVLLHSRSHLGTILWTECLILQQIHLARLQLQYFLIELRKFFMCADMCRRHSQVLNNHRIVESGTCCRGMPVYLQASARKVLVIMVSQKHRHIQILTRSAA